MQKAGVDPVAPGNQRAIAVAQTLSQFLPVPVEALTREFASGASPAAICARTIRTLRQSGARHVYVSNLPQRGTLRVLQSILDQI